VGKRLWRAALASSISLIGYFGKPKSARGVCTGGKGGGRKKKKKKKRKKKKEGRGKEA